MRGLLLVIVGATLLWLVLSKLSPVDASEPQEGEPVLEEPGRFLTRPERPAPKDPVNEVAQPVVANVPEVEVVEATPEPDPVPVAQEEPELPPVAYDSEWTSEQELALAASLLHAPSEIGKWIQRNGRGLSEGRRRLVLALAACIAGDRGRARSYADGLGEMRDVLAEERALLESALEPKDARIRQAGVNRESYVAHAASMALLANNARELLQEGESRDASKAYSELLLEELSAPWKADTATLATWSSELHRAQEGWRWNRNADWPSIEITVQPGDHLTRIRKRAIEARPDLVICTGLIERANGIRGQVIHPDDVLKIPTDRAHTLVDLSARWLLYMLGDEVVGAWQVGIGKPGHETRLGEFTAGEKETEPMWFRPGKDPVPFGDPKNPLGTRWIAWMTPAGKKSSLGFHGTNEPESMGGAVSEGCIRMRNEEVEVLFEILPRDTRIMVRP